MCENSPGRGKEPAFSQPGLPPWMESCLSPATTGKQVFPECSGHRRLQVGNHTGFPGLSTQTRGIAQIALCKGSRAKSRCPADLQIRGRGLLNLRQGAGQAGWEGKGSHLQTRTLPPSVPVAPMPALRSLPFQPHLVSLGRRTIFLWNSLL